jgi:hypothetical protein
MIRKDAASSKRLAALSPKALALFLMLVPHFDSHGKINGDPLYLKAEVVPLVPWFTLPVIRKCLTEIDHETNVKWFEHGGRWYLHSLSWREHQDLREERLGADTLPSHPSIEVRDLSGSSPGGVPPEVEVELEVKGKKKEKKKAAAAACSGGLAPPLAAAPQDGGNGADTPRLSPRDSTIEHLRGEVLKGTLTNKGARMGLLFRKEFGITPAQALEIFPDEEGAAT